MIFVESIRAEEKYDMVDVFSREKYYYKNSTIRIVGWETPISIIYREGNDIKIRFKKEIEKYTDGFKDASFEETEEFTNSVFDDIFAKNYYEEQPVRRLKYAINQYKKEQKNFEAVKLFPDDLKKLLSSSDLLQSDFAFNDAHSTFDALNYWFPVSVDSILSDYSKQKAVGHDECMIISFQNQKKYGRIGYDGRFYHFDFNCISGGCDVYSFKSGMTLEKTPKYLDTLSLYGLGYRFLKDYVIDPDNNCYNYDGELNESKTRHHKNIRLMNDIIRLLYKPSSDYCSDRPSTKITVPNDFTKFDVYDVERIIVPHLQSKNVLNSTALKQFMRVKEIIVKTGLQDNFESALRSILSLNKSSIYGGSNRNICGEKLFKNLKELMKNIGTEKMAGLLQNCLELKKEVAQLCGAAIAEFEVSDSEYLLISVKNRIPQRLKNDDSWKLIKPGTLVIFSCGMYEKACAATTATKSGLGLRRA